MPWYHCPDNWSADIPIYRIAEGTNLQQLASMEYTEYDECIHLSRLILSIRAIFLDI